MLTCTNGIVYKRTKQKKEWWYLRLYLVDDQAKKRKDKYKNKYIPTDLLATKRNLAQANALLYAEMQKYAAGEHMRFDLYCEEWLKRNFWVDVPIEIVNPAKENEVIEFLSEALKR